MSETRILFQQRIDLAYRYFEFLSATNKLGWIEKLELIDSRTDFGIPEVLSLLSPEHYDELKIEDPRGPRSFSGSSIFSKCRSIEIWGYSCPFNNQKVHVDHLFPQSKGGLTHHSNALHLCEFHNMSKFTDIHLIPWEKMPANNEWIVIGLNRLLDGARRTTRSKLYLPLKQLSQC